MSPAPVRPPVLRPFRAGRVPGSPAPPAVPATGPAYPASLGGSGATGYFRDQYGQPILLLGDEPWGLPTNAGAWGGTWQGDMDDFLTARSDQGFNVIYTSPMGWTDVGGRDNGTTWDGLAPFTGGDPGQLNNTFWARIDYLIDQAAAKGITIFFNCAFTQCIDRAGGPLNGKTNTQWQNYGAALAARYKDKPNIIWVIADDYYGTYDTQFTSWRTGLRGGGDTHLISIQNYSETTSRKRLDNGETEAWGTSYAEFNCVYAYEVGYFGVEFAYLESSPIPVLWLDGYFYEGNDTYAGGSGGYAFDRVMRQYAWHALTSGARGKVNGRGIGTYSSTDRATVTTDWWYANNAGNIRSAVEALPGWHQLIPDTSSALVTGGRGTRATYTTTHYDKGLSDNYVTASKTGDGSLALLYLSHATTITVDDTLIAAGYTSQWIDPISGATSTATPGGSPGARTFNSTAKGNNSQGDPDWALVLKGP